MTKPERLLGQMDGLWITGIVNGPTPGDPPYGAGCPIDGQRNLIIEMFYIEDQVLRLGLLTFGAEAFGEYIGAPPSTPEWVDVTDRSFGANVNRGNLRPNIDEDVDTYTFDLLDPDHGSVTRRGHGQCAVCGAVFDGGLRTFAFEETICEA